MQDNKPDIRQIPFSDIKKYVSLSNEKDFRATQINEWLWKKGISSFNKMSNIPIALQQKMQNDFSFHIAEIAYQQKSNDGTIKTAFKLFDNNHVEGVLILSEDRTTACISSQVGCSLACKFCATGNLGFTRNLLVGEIFDQVVLLNQMSLENNKKPLSNIVLMGMGEPLLNYENVLTTIHHITSNNGLGISPQRITLSTVGIHEQIKRLADDKIKFNLAVSLHSANNETRTKIIPANRVHNLVKLSNALKYFHEKTQSRITFEYLLLKGINNHPKDAEELARFCKSFPCKINIIEYNAVADKSFEKSDDKATNNFIRLLENKNILVTLRKSKGKDIDAACGQLMNKIGQ